VHVKRMARVMFGIKNEGSRSVGKNALKELHHYYLRVKSKLIRWTGNVAHVECSACGMDEVFVQIK